MLKFINVTKSEHPGTTTRPIIYTITSTNYGECIEEHSITLLGFVGMYKLVQKDLAEVSDIKCSSLRIL